MHVIYEDDGQLKAATVLADQETSLQVEAASGKRSKIKAANVLLRFARPTAPEALATAQQLAAELDPTFLWEVSGEDDFGFDALAREYYGASATAEQQTAVALVLHASPMHFYKRGKGRYRKAPPDALRAALASVERKAREAREVEAWAAELADGRLPEALRAKLPMLLYRPEKNALEWKALAAACEARKTGPVELLAAAGAIPSTHDYHFGRFVFDAFPKGTGFADVGPLPDFPDLPAGARARILDRRPHDHRDRRRVLGARARERPPGDRHSHRGASARDRAGQCARPHRARAAVHRLHARAQDHDAARRGDRRVHPRCRRRAARAVALRRDHARGRAGAARDAREQGAGGGQPAPRRAGGGVRQRPAVARRPAVDRRAACALEARLATRASARQARHRAHRLQLLRGLGRRHRDPDRAAWRSCRGRAARRSTSWWPS